MVHLHIRAFKIWFTKLPPFFVFWIGVFAGGIAGALLVIFALSAFLFQILQAISTAVLAIATVVLALSTFALYHSTRTLAGIELNRDRRKNLDQRINLGVKIIHTSPKQIVEPLKTRTPPINEQFLIAMSIRELRQLINYYESDTDEYVRQLLPLMDLLIMKMDKTDNSEKAIENAEDEKSVRGWIELMQKNLRILVVKWRGQMPYLYD